MSSIKARIRWIQHWLFVNLRKITLPGFRGAGLYDVLRFFLYGLTDAKFSLLAAAMASPLATLDALR